MKLFVDFKKITKIWKGLRHRNTELVLFWLLDVQNNLTFPTCKNSQKWVKNQNVSDKHSSFDGLIQEDIHLSDILLAVLGMYKSVGGLIQSWFLPWSSWVLYWPRKKQAQSSAYFYGAFTLGHHTNTQWIQNYFGAAFKFLNNTLS